MPTWHEVLETVSIYPYSPFREISRYCIDRNMRLCDFVEEVEGKEIWDFLSDVWEAMKRCIQEGLVTCGKLGGGLHVMRKAHYLYNQRHIDESAQTRENRLVCAYAFAVGEQNADCGTIVTAPTCGACGVLPAVLKYVQDTRGLSDEEICRLCDHAMCGDRGIAESFGCELELPKTIAKGDGVCQIRFVRK